MKTEFTYEWLNLAIIERDRLEDEGRFEEQATLQIEIDRVMDVLADPDPIQDARGA